METWTRLAAVALGGALGSCARYGLGVWISQKLGVRFPWATFSINASGAFVIGFLTTILARWLPHPHIRLLVLVGFLGGYTTFSTFAFESFTHWQRGEIMRSVVYMSSSLVAGFIAVMLGAGLAQAISDATEHRGAPAAALPSEPAPPSPDAPPGDEARRTP